MEIFKSVRSGEMKNIVYNFLDYNDKNNILYSTIEKISKDKESLIVIENGMAENYYK